MASRCLSRWLAAAYEFSHVHACLSDLFNSHSNNNTRPCWSFFLRVHFNLLFADETFSTLKIRTWTPTSVADICGRCPTVAVRLTPSVGCRQSAIIRWSLSVISISPTPSAAACRRVTSSDELTTVDTRLPPFAAILRPPSVSD